MDGKWVKTGALPSDPKDMQRKFTIDPPIFGNAFRVIIDKKHILGHEIQGRFDLWVHKLEELEEDSNTTAAALAQKKSI